MIAKESIFQRLTALESRADELMGQNKDLKALVENLSVERDKLKQENRELITNRGWKIDQLTSENEALQRKVETAEESLKTYLAFDQLIETVVQKHLPQGNGNVGLNLLPEQVEVTVNPANKRLIQVDSAKSYQGKILQVMLTDLKAQEWVTTVDVANALAEHGWPRSKESVRLDFLTLARDGLVVKDGTKYRLPKQVVFKATEGDQGSE